MPRTPEDERLIAAVTEQIKNAPPVPPQSGIMRRRHPMQGVGRWIGGVVMIVGVIFAFKASEDQFSSILLDVLFVVAIEIVGFTLLVWPTGVFPDIYDNPRQEHG